MSRKAMRSEAADSKMPTIESDSIFDELQTLNPVSFSGPRKPPPATSREIGIAEPPLTAEHRSGKKSLREGQRRKMSHLEIVETC